MGYKEEIKTVTQRTMTGYKIGPYLSVKNQTRAQFVLATLVYMTQAYVLCKLQGERNPLLSLKPYLYYGAGVVLLTQTKSYFLDEKIKRNLNNHIGNQYASRVINQVVSKILIGVCMAKAAKMITGESIQMSWKWEILSTVANGAARVVL